MQEMNGNAGLTIFIAAMMMVVFSGWLKYISEDD